MTLLGFVVTVIGIFWCWPLILVGMILMLVGEQQKRRAHQMDTLIAAVKGQPAPKRPFYYG